MMRPSDAERALRIVADEVTRLAAVVQPLMASLRDAEGPWPTSTGLSGGGRGCQVADPTALAAIHGDPAARDLARLGQIIRQLHALSGEASRIRTYWYAPAQRRREPPGCRVLAEVGAWAPVAGVVEGLSVGRWAADFHRRHGRLPNATEARRHAEGRRVA